MSPDRNPILEEAQRIALERARLQLALERKRAQEIAEQATEAAKHRAKHEEKGKL